VASTFLSLTGGVPLAEMDASMLRMDCDSKKKEHSKCMSVPVCSSNRQTSNLPIVGRAVLFVFAMTGSEILADVIVKTDLTNSTYSDMRLIRLLNKKWVGGWWHSVSFASGLDSPVDQI
jgi:hypothetical protein